MPPSNRYLFRYLALDSAMGLAYVLGLLYTFGQFAHYAEYLPWHPYSSVPATLLHVVIALEGVMVVAPVSVLILFGVRAIWDRYLLLRTLSVAMLPTALNLYSMLRAYDIVGAPGWHRIVIAIFPLVIPLLIAAFMVRRKSREGHHA